MTVKEDTASKKKKSKQKLINTENAASVPFSVVEAYKHIRVQLINILEKFGGKIIAISSPNASEGKSTTAINIAITMSQLEKKVIIVDADNRRGTVHKKMKLENDIGCTDILSGKTTVKEAVKHYNENLNVITCGEYSSSSSEMFDSSAFERLLKELSEAYDYVILDTPPINLVSDALVIAKKCDGLIYIIRSEVTTYEAFKKAVNSTEKLGVNLLGVILNAVDAYSGKYYKIGYGYYNKYGYYGNYGYYGKGNN